MAHVLIVGSAGIDVKGRPYKNTGEFGRVRQRVGGVARNIAENLARLEVETYLLTAVGRDFSGKRVLRESRSAGIDCSHVRVVPGARTCTSVTLLKPDGQPHVVVSDFEVMARLDAAYLLDHEALFADAEMIVIDATLSDSALAAVFELAERYQVRVCADPTSPALAGKLCQYLNRLYMVSPNAAETTALCGLANPAHDYDTAINAARHLVSLGVNVAVVTLGEKGLAYADSSGGGFIRAVNTRVVDATGAGDALSAAVIFGLLNEIPLDESMRLGVTAAALTLQSPRTVLRSLSQELLYDQLAI